MSFRKGHFRTTLKMDVSENIVGLNPPQIIPFVHRVFHDFHHPFWGKHPYFWKHPNGWGFNGVFQRPEFHPDIFQGAWCFPIFQVTSSKKVEGRGKSTFPEDLRAKKPKATEKRIGSARGKTMFFFQQTHCFSEPNWLLVWRGSS